MATHATSAARERVSWWTRLRSWRPARTTAAPNAPPKLWDFGIVTALLAVPVLWLAIAALLWATHALVGWPTAATGGGVLYVATFVGLVPVWLVLLDWLAERRAVLTSRFGGIDFSKGTAAATVRTYRLETGLGLRGQVLTDNHVVSTRATLGQAQEQDVVRLDLESGDAWWLTRVFALCAGAVTAGAPKVLVFVGRDGPSNAFLGWVTPADAFRLIRTRRPELNEVYERSQAVAHLLRTAEVTGQPVAVVDTTAVGNAVRAYEPDSRMQDKGEDVYLLVLLDQLGRFEQAQAQVERVTVGALENLLGDALGHDAVDLKAEPEAQLEEFLSSGGEYVAITREGRFVRLVERRSLENELLRQLVLPDDRAA